MGMIHDLLVRLGWDGSAYKRGLLETELLARKQAAKLEKQLDSFATKQAKGLAKLFVGEQILAGAARGFYHMAENAAKITTESARLGQSIQNYQAIQYASEETGRSIEEIVANIKSLPEDVRTAMKAFEGLGLAAPSERVRELTEAYRNIQEIKTGATIAGGSAAGVGAAVANSSQRINQTAAGMGRAWLSGLPWIGNRMGDQAADFFLPLFSGGGVTPEEESGRRKRLFDAQNRRSKEEAKSGRVVGPFSTMLDYELLKEKTEQSEAIKKAFAAKGALNPQGLDSLAKIGGFTGAAGREELLTIERQQLDLLERIKEILEKNNGAVGSNIL